MQMDASFGYWLRRRKVLDLTQEALAERVGCSTATIRKIEADERRPSRQIAEILATVLEIDPKDRPTFLQVARGERRTERLGAVAPPSVAGSPPAANPSPLAPRLPIPPTPSSGARQNSSS
jgi:transcriptional regulator with XRE-family HTH domain